MSSYSLALVIVTFNRIDDLKNTMRIYSRMQDEYSHIIVVDNASTDGTTHYLSRIKPDFNGKMHILTMQTNEGGAGGFHEGLRCAVKLNTDWVWMSDDDATPEENTLSNLRKHATDENNVYGSTAIATDSPDQLLCWPHADLSRTDKKNRINTFRTQMNPTTEVEFIPFLGFMISRKLTYKIGLPNKSYFISGDDVEYSHKVRASGGKCILIRDSILTHPRTPFYSVDLKIKTYQCHKLPPWRRFYDVRNRIWNATLTNGSTYGLAVSISLTFRLILTVLFEKEKFAQINAYLNGIIHGLFNYEESGNVKNIMMKKK